MERSATLSRVNEAGTLLTILDSDFSLLLSRPPRDITNLISLRDRRARTYQKVKDLVNEQPLKRRVVGPGWNPNPHPHLHPHPNLNPNPKSNLVGWRRPAIKHTEDWLVEPGSVSVPVQVMDCFIPEQFTQELTQYQQDLDEDVSNYQGKQFPMLILRHMQVQAGRADC